MEVGRLHFLPQLGFQVGRVVHHIVRFGQHGALGLVGLSGGEAFEEPLGAEPLEGARGGQCRGDDGDGVLGLGGGVGVDDLTRVAAATL